jgi:hypothetical protein
MIKAFPVSSEPRRKRRREKLLAKELELFCKV